MRPDSAIAWFWLAVTRDNRGQEASAPSRSDAALAPTAGHRTFVQYRIGLPGGYAALMVPIVDDDRSVRRGVGRFLHSAGYTVETYRSARDFRAAETRGPTAHGRRGSRTDGLSRVRLPAEL